MTDNLLTFPQLRASRAKQEIRLLERFTLPKETADVIPLIDFKHKKERDDHIKRMAETMTTTGTRRHNHVTRLLVSTDRGEFVSLFHVGQMVAERGTGYFGKVTGVFLETDGWWHGRSVTPYFIYRVDFYGLPMTFHEGELRAAKPGETFNTVLGSDWFGPMDPPDQPPAA